MRPRMSRTVVIALAVIAALLPGVAIVVCIALISFGLAVPVLAGVRAQTARPRVEPVSLLALPLFRAPPALLA